MATLEASGRPWLELLLTHYSGQFRDKFDALIAFVHWVYVGEGFLCLGSPRPDMEMTPARAASLLRDSDGGSEMLPAGWNTSPDTWSLAYKLPTQSDCSCSSSSSSTTTTPTVILLKAVRIGDELTVNVIKPGSDNVSSLSLLPADQVEDDLAGSKPQRVFKSIPALTTTVMTGIVNPFLPPKNPSTSRTDSDRVYREDDPQGADGRNPASSLRDPRSNDDPLRDLGRADLDPFSGGRGGGMIFDPMRAGGRGGGNTPFGPDGRPLPQGAVPPGARFDPFAPPGVGGIPDRGRGRGRGRGFGPDPDHEPPPGWDDMFM